MFYVDIKCCTLNLQHVGGTDTGSSSLRVSLIDVFCVNQTREGTA